MFQNQKVTEQASQWVSDKVTYWAKKDYDDDDEVTEEKVQVQ